MTRFEKFQQECPCKKHEHFDIPFSEEVLCTARNYIDLCAEHLCPAMKEMGDGNEEPVR